MTEVFCATNKSKDCLVKSNPFNIVVVDNLNCCVNCYSELNKVEIGFNDVLYEKLPDVKNGFIYHINKLYDVFKTHQNVEILSCGLLVNKTEGVGLNE